ncbi:hypothetical protein [Bacillus cereus group sp. BfR-BA-01383]|uniref:hypothetical protein n=1 Tax=Bacillus cereus group sp. BfR-BA-01383 TaxID=2920327 RepID=UPI001F5A876F|nr:hypothetical protein [Bacillus cereus group sp. BfR-BA-01383]
MDPDLPLKVLVSGDTLSIDEVPHEGRVAINVEEYTVRAIKKGNGTITIDLMLICDWQMNWELT